MTQPTQEQLQELIKLYESRNLDEAEVEVKNLLKTIIKSNTESVKITHPKIKLSVKKDFSPTTQ